MDRKRKHLRNLGVLGVYCLLTILLTWPLPVRMSTHLAGDDVDVWINLWADWWTEKALTEGLDFYTTDYLFYPHGTSLVFHSFSHVNTAVTLLLKPVIGHFAAYNLTIMATYALSGFSMYLLARYLTGHGPAAFVAGLIFAFHPYHVFQSSHPVLVTTQFMPLFILSFLRLLHRDQLTRRGRIGHVLLASLWFLLTALSSWHLMLMLAGWAFLYLLYHFLFDRKTWAPGAVRRLVLLAGVTAVILLPFLRPILEEQLTRDASYMAVDVEEGRGNDLLALFIPNRLHPVLGPVFLEANAEIGYTRNAPPYLGFVALGVAAIGIATSRRKARFWWLSGLLFLVLSLGAQLNWRGDPLLGIQLPWARPIISVLRHPLRLNTLVFLSLAVLTAFGVRRVHRRIAACEKRWAVVTVSAIALLILFEYWVYPFPTTRPTAPPVLDQIAREEGDFAVAHFPSGRQFDKVYMYYQTIHGKKMIGGVVSRTPDDAQAFMESQPLLSAIQNGNVPPTYVEERLAVLAAMDIRYILINKNFLRADEWERWQRWLDHFPAPFYEDERVVAYRTIPPLDEEIPESVRPLDVRLGDAIHLQGVRVGASSVAAGASLTVTLFWRADRRLEGDYHVFVHLLDAEGDFLAQSDTPPVQGERPTWSWWGGELVEDRHVLQVPPQAIPGTYFLSVGMYEMPGVDRLPAVQSSGERFVADRIPLQEIRVTSP